MKPIVDEVAKDYEGAVEFRILDIDQPEAEKESKKFGLNVIPTFLFFDRSGKQVDRVEGKLTKSEFVIKIENLQSDH